MDLAIDRYRVTRLIGQGAMGKIYQARDPKLERDVAIKILTAPKEDSAVRRRFRLEARAIASLKHPNIVELYDYSGEDAADMYLVMEYVPGRTLHDFISERGPMPESIVSSVSHELTLALMHAHAHKVIHRDIKPDNVLLYQGRIVLTDFGIVKQAAGGTLEPTRVSSQTKVLGTPGFMAPEQFTGKDLDHRTDVFAMGAVMYHLSTGHLPFAGSSIDEVIERVRSGRYEDPREYSPLLSEGYCTLIANCLKPSPRDRYQTAEELRGALLELLTGLGVSEIRGELVAYERDPAAYEQQQRERGMGVLMRDLKLAIDDHDERRMQAIVRRMQTIAPLDRERMRGVAGLAWDRKARPRLVDIPRPLRRKWFASGAAVGLLVGFFLGLAMLIRGTVPSALVAWIEQLLAAVGLG